jgi:propionyl-CoA carboxylase beta chain
MSEPEERQAREEIDIHTTAGKLADLQRRIEEATHAGSARAVDKQHAKGKLTARERIELLLDEDSFVELDEFARHRSTNFGLADNQPYGDGVVTGYASGVIPQISLVVGPCAGGAVYSPAITDFTVMVDQTSHMFITGPDVIKTVTGEDVGFEELGGARTHNTASGVAHHMAGDEKDAIEYIKQLLSYLPSNNLSEPPAFPEEADLAVTDEDRELDTLVPDSANQPYDIHTVIEHVLDDAEFFETQPLYAPNIVTGYGRIEGRPVGIVANQPMQFAGCLDIKASEKAARFVRTCDAFNIPVLTFVDVPGFLPGVDQEHDGIIRRGAKLIFAYAEATVPLITVITRKAFGGAYDVMGSKHLGADLNLAWPTAQIAVMGAQGAVNILHRRTIAAADDAEATRARLIQEYEDTLLNPYVAAERGYVDAVIMPSDTRAHLVRGLRQLRTKRESLPPKKHGNIPL